MTFSPVANVCVAKHNKEYHRAYYKRNNIDNQQADRLDRVEGLRPLSESSKPQDIEKKLQMLLTKKNMVGSGFITVKN